VIAHLRALTAFGANERARATLETLAVELEAAVSIFMEGVFIEYTSAMGEPAVRSATGRDSPSQFPSARSKR
jgi:hypothetical protein